MKKLLKNKWLYIFMFVTATILITNVITTSVIKRNINKQRSIVSEQEARNNVIIYEKEETNQASTPVLVEENEPPEENEALEQPEDEGFTSPLNGEIINKFSGSELVYSKTLKEYRVHKGIDIKGEILSQVKACASGVAESVTKDGLMGITLIIDHQNGFKSVYSNLSSEDMIKAGEYVKKGEIINGVGDTALIETGEEAHLHFELIKDGLQVNPEEYF